MGKLPGQIALVTGAGQGVGQGIALALAAEGAAVAVAGRTLAKCEETAKQIAARGGRAFSLRCDVNDAGDVQRTIDATVRELGGL